MTNTDKCADIKLNQIKAFLRDKKGSDKSISLTGNKEKLCAQYLILKNKTTSTSTTTVQKKFELKKELSTVKLSIDKIDTTENLLAFQNKVNKLFKSHLRKIAFTKNSKKEDIYDHNVYVGMIKNKKPMKAIIHKLDGIKKPNVLFEIGKHIVPHVKQDLHEKYTRSEIVLFLEKVDRNYVDEDWLTNAWNDEDDAILKDMLRSKKPMKSIVSFLKKKDDDDDSYWTCTMLVMKDELGNLYSEKDIALFQEHIILV